MTEPLAVVDLVQSVSCRVVEARFGFSWLIVYIYAHNMWPCTSTKSGASGNSNGWSERHCDLLILHENGHISPTCLIWGKGIFWCFSIFFLFVEPRGLIIPNGNGHWRPVTGNFEYFYLEETEIADVNAQGTGCGQLDHKSQSTFLSVFIVKLAAQTCTVCCTACRETRKPFCASWILLTWLICRVESNSSSMHLYMTLHVLCSV